MYYKIADENHIILIGTGNGGIVITKEEYETILSIIKNRPVAEEGYVYKLRTDLTWELCEVPAVEDDAEATEEDFLAALEELGVSVNEEV